jgi:hypothetical protein
MTTTHERFEQHTKGWPGGSFRNKVTSLRVRRVIAEGRDEAQIEIHICEVTTSGRLRSTCSSFILNPEDAAKFSQSLLITRADAYPNNANEALALRQRARQLSTVIE